MADHHHHHHHAGDEQLDQVFAKFRTLLDEVPTEKTLIEGELSDRTKPKRLPADDVMDDIVAELRKLVPAIAEAPGEKIFIPKTEGFRGYTKKNTIHIDDFLYPTDEDIDMLCEEGELSRSYCGDCGSRNVQDLNFVSHSASLSQLKYIFSEDGVGNLKGKKVVDIGSRLGAVLYAGYYYSEAEKLIGVEKNEWFTNLQKNFVKKRKLDDRIEIIGGDILQLSQVLTDADVIVMNNVFEFFVNSPKLMSNLWASIKAAANKKGCILVTIPSIETSFADAGVSF
ncbi:hypothetical protein PROFUN_04226 [Planoprotostelium fungivorum]|uniref:Methyltransferase type 11 domain-containing protein n=1 Tax=Planoprotostelium fungivorum TaxID=1890364 RepID=A0A2P6NVZ7_9EUKA|nr:hypothetical protein PROFUN_04226 [Planoprotostelium fungivorum]